MTTCRCCGQAVLPGEATRAARGDEARADAPRRRAGIGLVEAGEVSHGHAGHAAINVDEALLLVCNEAHLLADEQASGSVEIAHLVVRLVAAQVTESEFRRAGIDRRRLSEAARAWLHGAGRAPDGRRPRTSHDLKVLLSRAEAVAALEARGFAGPFDCIQALAHRSDDLASARFVAEAIERGARPGDLSDRATQQLRQNDRVETRRAEMGERGPRPSQLQSQFERRYRPLVEPQARHDHGGVDGSSAGRDAAARRHGIERERRSQGDFHDDKLAERLQRQEALVADLVGLIARVIDTRGDEGSARDAMVAARQCNEEGAEASGGSGSSVGRASRGRSGLRFRRRRTLVIGSGSRSSSSRGERDGGLRGQESRLRVVSRNETDATGRRFATAREQAPDIDDSMGSPGEFEADDEGYGHGEGYAPGEGLGDRMKRFYLSPDDDIVKAPSIGPKTAARLTPMGLVLVRDLLACDPEDIVTRTANRYITVARISDWKAQARLVCTIPWLRGTHAQLLVGAGYDTLAKLSRADASSVCSAILRFSATREGQSILRSGPPPEIDRIACWIENTALAEPARAA